MPPSALMSLERAAIDSQIATAHAYPRSLELFKKRALSMATLDLPTAESCIYSRPVGGGKTAEGASIRLAEIVAASYGNIRVAARIIEQTERYVKCEGLAHDLESNYAGKSECIEPTVKQNGDPYSESQRAVVAKACLSKAYRDAVFKVVPKALCKSVIDAAIGVINKQVVSLEDRRKRVRDWFKQIKVADNRVFNVLQVKGWSEVSDDHLILLTGLKTAINDGDTTIEESFPNIISTPVFNTPPKPGEHPPEVGQATQPTPPEPTVTGPAPAEEDSPVKKLRKLCKEHKVKESEVVDALIVSGSVEPGTKTLEEVALQSEGSLKMAIQYWGDLSQRIKQAAAA